MKIVFTGGGTGGHFYPIIAVAQEVNRLVSERHLVAPELYFIAPKPYDEGLLYDNHIKFVKVSAGKVRRYVSFMNIIDIIWMPFSVLWALWKILSIYPDVIFSKGGYGSFPTLVAARFFRIPIMIHESDTVPGKVNLWAGKFAYRVALSYPEAAQYFTKAPISITGNPIRKDIQVAAHETGKQFFDLKPGIPVLLILGGSQGSRTINESILEALPELVKNYYVIHQTGTAKFKEITQTVKVVLETSNFKDRYKPHDHLKPLDLKMAAGAADLAISRAGSTLFELASWQLPSIIIPITSSNGDHQRKNAFAYARTGSCIIIEENNLTPHVLLTEINRVMNDAPLREKMKQATATFSKPDAAEKIASELLTIGLSHET